ncbi:MAG: acetyl-CoA decarbonylase/synthase complex subunit gamma [Planctomycetota bacterium]
MALTAMEVYKNLPKTNCGDCGFPTCMAFAMQVAAKQKALTDCPHLSDEAKEELSAASAPPMQLVRIGPDGDGSVELGQETVMFRHEEKFHRPPALAGKIPASLSDEEALARLEQVNDAVFTRVGDDISMRLAAVELDGLAADAAAQRAQALSEKSRVPFVLMGTDPEGIRAAASAIGANRPLLYRATPDNAEAFVKIAAENDCPLAVSADTLEELADLTQAAKEGGVPGLLLAFDGRETVQTLRSMTQARRAALRKGFRPLGFPAMVDASHEDLTRETVVAATFADKYAGIIILNHIEPAALLPLLTTIQNIYTDPQVPNTVEAKLYEIGDVNENSPVLFTTNFSLTYFCVEAEVERSRIPSYISVADTEGLGILNAYAGDKLRAETVVKTLTEQGVAEKVNHHKLIIPGLLPMFRAEIEDTSEWTEVLIGPENASGIPAFLAEKWAA